MVKPPNKGHLLITVKKAPAPTCPLYRGSTVNRQWIDAVPTTCSLSYNTVKSGAYSYITWKGYMRLVKDMCLWSLVTPTIIWAHGRAHACVHV